MNRLSPQGALTVGGKTLEYYWTGKGVDDKPLLILLHEGLGCVELWKDFPDRLSELTGCDVFAYSRAGYGKSDPVSLPRPITYMHHEGLKVLPELLDLIGREEVVLVGHSDGASISLINKGGTADVRVRALVVMAPHVFTETICIESIEAAREAYNNGDLRGQLARYHADVDVAFRGWNDAWLDPRFLDWDIQEYLPAIDVPVLVIQGEDDEYGTVAQVDAVRTGIKGPSTYRLLSECRHSPHRDQPSLTLESIREFLKQSLPTLSGVSEHEEVR